MSFAVVLLVRKNGLCQSSVALSIIFQKKTENGNTSMLQKQVHLQQLMFKEMKRKPLLSVSVTIRYFFIISNKIVHMNEDCLSPKVGTYSLLPLLSPILGIAHSYPFTAKFCDCAPRIQ